MRRQQTLTIALAACAALALGACGADEGAGNPDSELTPAEATAPLENAPPALAAVREQANEIIEGDTEDFERRISELRGHPVVINKWASWCGPCRLEFPWFQTQADQRAGEVAFLGLLSDDSKDAGATFLEELPLPYPSYYDPDQKLASLIEAPRNFPATAFYASSGELVYTHQGVYADEGALAADIERYAE